jgi:predicted CoA-binding protein
MPKKVSKHSLKTATLNGVDDKKYGCPTHENAHIAGIFESVKTIAMVGASPKSHRAGYPVMKFLREPCYRVIPVNTHKSYNSIHGEKIYGSLAEIPDNF